MDKKIIKFDNTEIEEYKIYQHKSSISINDIGINKIVASNKFLFGKKDFKYLCIFIHKRVYIKEILIKLNVCMF